MRASEMRTTSFTPRVSRRAGMGAAPHSGIPGARAPHAALHRVGDLPEVRVAVRELGPRVGDADDGTAVEHGVAEPLGLEVVAPEPVAASELVCCHGSLRGTDYGSRGTQCGSPARSRS